MKDFLWLLVLGLICYFGWSYLDRHVSNKKFDKELCTVVSGKDSYSITCPESKLINFCQEVDGKNTCKLLEK